MTGNATPAGESPGTCALIPPVRRVSANAVGHGWAWYATAAGGRAQVPHRSFVQAERKQVSPGISGPVDLLMTFHDSISSHKAQEYTSPVNQIPESIKSNQAMPCA